jgi:hypothetical protein
MRRLESKTCRSAPGIVAGSAACALLALSAAAAVCAQDGEPQRPAPRFSRWQEDWSALADASLRSHPGDRLKYIPLDNGDANSYFSLGLNLRERMEYNGAAAFGAGGNRADGYLIQRLQVHADLHLDAHWQIFTQLEDARDPGKRITTPADRNPVDLRLAFIAYNTVVGENTFRFRLGRQEFAFDLQRFVSLRDGPNVRQAFDALWAGWESQHWHVIGFLSQPVQYRDERDFDDYSNRHLRFNMLRVEHLASGSQELSAYYALYARDNARYLDTYGRESRDVFDTRYAGTAHGLDWDLETMIQHGAVGGNRVRAWAVGTRVGYTFADTGWWLRLGLQLDGASGDRRGTDHTLGTFNPLFPNGYYLTLAGYSGYLNFVHVKPSVTVRPTGQLTLTAAFAVQWRQTTADAVYSQPNIAIAGTAGRPGRRTGNYGQLRGDYAINSNLAAAVEMVHFNVGDALRRAGAHDSNYLGLELKYQW